MPALLALCLSLTVHDGDTIRCGLERIRIANIDAPELRGSPRCNVRSRAKLAGSRNPPWCNFVLGQQSRDELRQLVARGAVRIEREGRDRYGRTLARLTVDGRDVGAYLIGRGLARGWRTDSL